MEKINYKKTALNSFILIAVFGLGLLIGSDKFTLGSDSVFRKSVQNTSSKIDYSAVEEVYSALVDGYDGQLDPQKLEDGLKAGIVKASGDPYTEFLNAEAAREFDEDLSGTFEGIGAELGKDEESIIIISPIDGFPAQKAGIKARDIITKINDETAYDITISDAVKKIRGEKGTKVKLQIIRDGKVLDFEITREQINLPSVTHEITAENIGIVKITRFGDDTDKLVMNAVKEFKTKSVKGVVLDMRGNPGGLLDQSVKVASIWLPKGAMILEEKRAGKTINTFKSNGNASLLGMPTVVLVDEGSASASEIVAGALRDNNVATIVGQKTFGKGSVQELRKLSDGGVLKVTIARWFTPSGKNIDKEGIEPDEKIEITDADIEAKRDSQKDAAIKRLN